MRRYFLPSRCPAPENGVFEDELPKFWLRRESETPDLGDAFANFEHYCRGAHHSCFTGLYRCGPHTYYAQWDS